MILHISHLNKFIVPFIELVNAEFPDQDHHFWLSGAKRLDQYPLELRANLHFDKRTYKDHVFSNLKLFMMLTRADKVILHGLNRRVIKFLLLQPALLKKCYWIIRGADLYRYQEAKHGLKDRLREHQRAFVIRRMGNLVTYIPGDVELARQWYGAKGAYHECLAYLSNTVEPFNTRDIECPSKDSGKLNILIGNSADPSNNHQESLNLLLPYKNDDIQIYTPLSYGDKKHAEKIISLGRNLFGEKFTAMTEFMTYGNYISFLENIDIAIFNHDRQQAMGNTITLIGLGKTVYVRPNLAHSRFLSDLGISLKPSSNITLTPLNADERHSNIKIVQSYFSKDRLVHQLSNIFET